MADSNNATFSKLPPCCMLILIWLSTSEAWSRTKEKEECNISDIDLDLILQPNKNV